MSKRIEITPSMQPYVWILLSSFAFSLMAVLTPLASRGSGWQIVAIARCTVPLVLITLWARRDGVALTLRGSRILWVRSLAGSCSLVCCFYAFTHLPITDVIAISGTFPIWIALLSWPILGRLPSPVVWLSIVSGVAGVFVLQGSQLQHGNPTVLVAVALSLFTAIAMMGLNRLKHMDPRAIVVHFSATALAFAMASYFIFPSEPTIESFTGIHLVELLGVGLAASCGQYCLTRAFTAGDATRVAVASLSQFVMVFVLDVAVLGTAIDWDKLWGVPLIVGPTIWLMSRRESDADPLEADGATDPPEHDGWAMCAGVYRFYRI